MNGTQIEMWKNEMYDLKKIYLYPYFDWKNIYSTWKEVKIFTLNLNNYVFNL